ncbi:MULTISPECIES: DUF3021 family protein [Curtobacterium]|uniref:DUF3021 family protein n=1 Tax=Curtobacterium poinsettiae TaxID=159612 RepID=A0ABT3S0N2_9MICO|nr:MULTISPECIES: DUF3021 family protein [Curtobacterium]MCS6567046.1 DUF3021 domain-containing protein [Curtobacterium flaccumfaciens pv. flaccumfaciens]MCS6574119.1 DUF3021 domain-containing protein [Curtobacterium flaccumfaciens pv. flaccumfaciens]MCU0152477.1 DUF3021 domain-containing protein [Curtobacterium flaccumfaciens pv. poinsettiae]MCX2848381.1 DUF3021 family protein [Curtobacterium flaccumfaciens pv. poinsettiae]MDD1385925.1 DUF3021 family protein [Curtobacterium flaccumfaciens pv. 
MRAVLLAAIPLVLMSAIGAFLLHDGQAEDGRSTFTVGVIIAAVSASSVIYQVDRWSLMRQSLTHLTMMLVTVLPALLLSGWFPVDTVGGVLLVVAVFALVGLVLWSSLFLIMRFVERRQAARVQ